MQINIYRFQFIIFSHMKTRGLFTSDAAFLSHQESKLTCTLSYGRITKPLFEKRILFKLNVSLTEIILAVKYITKPL